MAHPAHGRQVVDVIADEHYVRRIHAPLTAYHVNRDSLVGDGSQNGNPELARPGGSKLIALCGHYENWHSSVPEYIEGKTVSSVAENSFPTIFKHDDAIVGQYPIEIKHDEANLSVRWLLHHYRPS
jgi:hypothetical protein